jgi:hypothetical protein
MLTPIILPRQAQDKHRKSWEKWRVLQVPLILGSNRDEMCATYFDVAPFDLNQTGLEVSKPSILPLPTVSHSIEWWSFYQDRLGTNIERDPKENVFSQALAPSLAPIAPTQVAELLALYPIRWDTRVVVCLLFGPKCKNDHFTATGSGQTDGKLKNPPAGGFLQRVPAYGVLHAAVLAGNQDCQRLVDDLPQPPRRTLALLRQQQRQQQRTGAETALVLIKWHKPFACRNDQLTKTEARDKF